MLITMLINVNSRSDPKTNKNSPQGSTFFNSYQQVIQFKSDV